jgi:hypothetical protein
MQNFALDEFKPVVMVNYKMDSLSFIFDTGAQTSDLDFPFFIKYKTEIEGKYAKKTFFVGGAGGFISVEGYEIDEINLKIGTSSSDLEDLRLYSKQFEGATDKFFGKIGQDYIRNFNKVIISFENMFINFE